MDPVDLGAVEPASEKTFAHDFTIPETHVSSQMDDPDIVVTYSLLVKVEPDVTFFRSVNIKYLSIHMHSTMNVTYVLKYIAVYGISSFVYYAEVIS